MTQSLENIIGIITIVSFCCGVVNYTVIKPLRTSIDTLSDGVQELKKVLNDVDHRVDGVITQVSLNEREIKDLKGRVTDLEGYHKQPINGGKYS